MGTAVGLLLKIELGRKVGNATGVLFEGLGEGRREVGARVGLRVGLAYVGSGDGRADGSFVGSCDGL